MPTLLTLKVNGEERDVLAPAHKTLLEVLREELNLTGTKHGCEPLGVEDWRAGRRRFPSLRAGRTMINVHQVGRPVGLDAVNMQVGSEDLCFEWSGPIEGAVERLRAHDVAIEVGPVKRFGARGREGTSVYFRDPDGNLLELLTLHDDGG